MIKTEFKIQTSQGTFDESNYQWIEKFLVPIEASLNTIVSEKDLDVIAGIIRKDIINERISGGRDIFGSAYHPLAPSTIKAKGNARPLVDKGILRESIKTEHGKDFRRIFIGGARAEIAEYLQYGTRKMDPFPFFGISDEALKEIGAYLDSLDILEKIKKDK